MVVPQMRRSRVLEVLRKGKTAFSFKTNLSDSRSTELASFFGFDCIWTDMEHTANDWSAVEKQVLAAKTQDVDVLVRVPRGGYSDYIKPFELDASGIMVPHVMSKKDAEGIVSMTRYQPLGRRPVDGGSADGRYFNLDFADYLKQSNEKKFVIAQIEDPEAFDELDGIASVEGIDIILFGPGDFGHRIGVPGQWNHPKIIEARKRVAAAAHAHNKVAGTVGNADNIEELIETGYRFINMGADVEAISRHCKMLGEKIESLRANGR